MALRDGWTETTLGDLCDVRDGTHDSPKRSDVGYPLVTSKNIRDGEVDLSDVYLISDSDFHEINKRSKVDQFDLLISMIGTVGEVCFEPGEPAYAIKNVGLIKTRNELLGRFLFSYLSSGIGQDQINLAISGSTQKFIGLGKLRSLRILLPPVVEQKRIVDLVSSVDSYIDSLQSQVDAARTARNAVLHELLSAGGDNWTETTLGDVAEWFSGGTPKAGKSEFYENGTFPWVVIADMMRTEIFDTATKITAAGLAEIGGRLAPEGSVLISMYATVGRPGYAHMPVATNQAIAWSIPNLKIISSRFLLHVAQYLEPTISSMARGATQRNINRAMLREFSFNLPPLVEQDRIVEIISSMDDVIRASEQAVLEAKKLRSGLLSDLLSGEHEIPSSYDNLMGVS